MARAKGNRTRAAGGGGRARAADLTPAQRGGRTRVNRKQAAALRSGGGGLTARATNRRGRSVVDRVAGRIEASGSPRSVNAGRVTRVNNQLSAAKRQRGIARGNAAQARGDKKTRGFGHIPVRFRTNKNGGLNKAGIARFERLVTAHHKRPTPATAAALSKAKITRGELRKFYNEKGWGEGISRGSGKSGSNTAIKRTLAAIGSAASGK